MDGHIARCQFGGTDRSVVLTHRIPLPCAPTGGYTFRDNEDGRIALEEKP